MIIYPANAMNPFLHYWAGKLEKVSNESIGLLWSPRQERPNQNILWQPWFKLAIDNGAWIYHTKALPFDEIAFFRHFKTCLQLPVKPEFVAVPDVVCDKDATLQYWDKWTDTLNPYKVPLALVVQDGMTHNDVAAAAPDLLFIGGSTQWKWQYLPYWLDYGLPVHVGRCPPGKLIRCHELGVHSVDSSGWFRDPINKSKLENYLKYVTGEYEFQQLALNFSCS